MLSIEYLSKINETFCYVSIIRDTTYLNVINDYYKIALNSNDNEFLYCAFKVACLIKLYQPFCDGNHRTSLVVLSDLLSTRGYIFDLETALYDLENHTLHLPLLYDSNEEIDDISNYKKYISNNYHEKKLIM